MEAQQEPDYRMIAYREIHTYLPQLIQLLVYRREMAQKNDDYGTNWSSYRREVFKQQIDDCNRRIKELLLL